MSIGCIRATVDRCLSGSFRRLCKIICDAVGLLAVIIAVILVALTDMARGRREGDR